MTLINNNQGENTYKAMDIAKERYTIGQTSKDEYQNLKNINYLEIEIIYKYHLRKSNISGYQS